MADSTGSMIASVFDMARAIVEEPIGESQYDDAFLARQVLPACWTKVWNACRLGAQNPALIKFTFTATAGVEEVRLPPCIGQIWRVGKFNSTTGELTDDWRPDGEFHPWGPGWSIQQNMLTFRPYPVRTETDWAIWFVPSADALLHRGTGVAQSTTRLGVALDATPDIGLLDPRVNAYVGSVFRLINNTGVPVDERVIKTFTASTRVATWSLAFDSTNYPASGASVNYEIAPLGYNAVWDALSYKIAMWIGTARNISEKRMAFLAREYQESLKAARDVLGNYNLRRQWHVDWRNYDNPDYGKVG